MINNPFAYSQPISKPDRFIGREYELHKILSGLGDKMSISIIGERRIGKTSLLKILPQELLGEASTLPTEGSPLPTEASTQDAHETYFIYLDLQMIESKDKPIDFWNEVLDELADRVPDSELKETIQQFCQAGIINTRALNKLFRQLGHAGLSIVLLLDELERLAYNPNFKPDFFYELRSLVINHRLALVTTSYTELSNLSLTDQVGASPFFNIFSKVYLGSFKPNEVNQLFDHYLAGTGIQFTSEERDFLISIAGFHPYYLAVAGRLLFDAHLNLLPASGGGLANLKRSFRAEVEGALAYSWSHTKPAEKVCLLMLALLSRSSGGEAPASFRSPRLANYYRTANRILERLIKRGVVIEQNGNLAIFSTVFAEWIRDELQDTQPSSESYEAWLNEPARQSSLKRIKDSVVDEVTKQLFPVIKPNSRDWILGWLMRARDVDGVVALLRLLTEELESREGDISAETIVKPLIMTEGKTDWKHLKAAWRTVKAAGLFKELEIEFEEYEEEIKMGSSELRNLCVHSSKIPQVRPIICIFDRDEPKIMRSVSVADKAYKGWGNNVFSFIIPVPDHRQESPNISIEFYYTDSEIMQADKHGRRLFLSDEFNPSSRHKHEDLTCTDLNKVKRKDVSIIDNQVFDRHHRNVALPKSPKASLPLTSCRKKRVLTISMSESSARFLIL
jgi:hypothetical protein